MYLVNRYYDPSSGQFISPDPMVRLTGQPYSYAANDPPSLVDPSGLGPCNDAPAGGAAVMNQPGCGGSLGDGDNSPGSEDGPNSEESSDEGEGEAEEAVRNIRRMSQRMREGKLRLKAVGRMGKLRINWRIRGFSKHRLEQSEKRARLFPRIVKPKNSERTLKEERMTYAHGYKKGQAVMRMRWQRRVGDRRMDVVVERSGPDSDLAEIYTVLLDPDY